jgi:hypothetical protein
MVGRDLAAVPSFFPFELAKPSPMKTQPQHRNTMQPGIDAREGKI